MYKSRTIRPAVVWLKTYSLVRKSKRHSFVHTFVYGKAELVSIRIKLPVYDNGRNNEQYGVDPCSPGVTDEYEDVAQRLGTAIPKIEQDVSDSASDIKIMFDSLKQEFKPFIDQIAPTIEMVNSMQTLLNANRYGSKMPK